MGRYQPTKSWIFCRMSPGSDHRSSTEYAIRWPTPVRAPLPSFDADWADFLSAPRPLAEPSIARFRDLHLLFMINWCDVPLAALLAALDLSHHSMAMASPESPSVVSYIRQKLSLAAEVKNQTVKALRDKKIDLQLQLMFRSVKSI